MYVCMYVCTYVRTYGRTDGRTDGWMDGCFCLLVNSHLTLENNPAINGKTQYFNWTIFHSYIRHYQRVLAGAFDFVYLDSKPQDQHSTSTPVISGSIQAALLEHCWSQNGHQAHVQHHLFILCRLWDDPIISHHWCPKDPKAMAITQEAVTIGATYHMHQYQCVRPMFLGNVRGYTSKIWPEIWY